MAEKTLQEREIGGHTRCITCEAHCVTIEDLRIELDRLTAQLREAEDALGETCEALAVEAQHSEQLAAQLKEETRRLDWLEAHGCGQFVKFDSAPPEKRWFDYETDGHDYSQTLREAIDAALAATEPNP